MKQVLQSFKMHGCCGYTSWFCNNKWETLRTVVRLFQSNRIEFYIEISNHNFLRLVRLSPGPVFIQNMDIQFISVVRVASIECIRLIRSSVSSVICLWIQQHLITPMIDSNFLIRVEMQHPCIISRWLENVFLS